MELKYELIRDVLLIVEQKKNLYDYLNLDDVYSELDNNTYSKDDLIYTLLKSDEAGLINAKPAKGTNYSIFLIGHLTYNGHNFLSSVADENVWEETKTKASKLKSVTIPVLQQLAVSIMNKQLNLD
ncbi:MAG: DUF2513 domain-containing protein [Staphylococcus pseudoxylosus]|uniref:DUF2513 domain-containing protein n=1 Tax=Staphylococcus pseudoxylosus TaxID=2282419 RepID=UPI0031F6D85D